MHAMALFQTLWQDMRACGPRETWQALERATLPVFPFEAWHSQSIIGSACMRLLVQSKIPSFFLCDPETAQLDVQHGLRHCTMIPFHFLDAWAGLY